MNRDLLSCSASLPFFASGDGTDMQADPVNRGIIDVICSGRFDPDPAAIFPVDTELFLQTPFSSTHYLLERCLDFFPVIRMHEFQCRALDLKKHTVNTA